MSRLEHVVAVGHGLKASRDAEADTGTVFDLYYKDANGEFHPMPATYDDNRPEFVFRRVPTPPAPAPAPHPWSVGLPTPYEDLPMLSYDDVAVKINEGDVEGLRELMRSTVGGLFSPAPTRRWTYEMMVRLVKLAIEHLNTDAVQVLMDYSAASPLMVDKFKAEMQQMNADVFTLAGFMYLENKARYMLAGSEKALDILYVLSDALYRPTPEVLAMADAERAKSPRDPFAKWADQQKPEASLFGAR